MPPERRKRLVSPPQSSQRPLTTTFAPAWLRGTTIKGGTEAFANLPAIAELVSEAGLEAQAKSQFGIDQPVAGYRARDAAPIPSADDREAYYRGDDPGYWLSGLSDALSVIKQAARLGSISGTRYFELGCASGRVVRHIAIHTTVPITCCDINKRHTEWVRLYLPERINVFHTSAIPNLPIEDNSVDVVAAFSVFTHIDDFEAAWLLELRRILRPGGLAYLTLQTDHTWEQYKRAWIKDQLIPIADKVTEYALTEEFFSGGLPREKTVIWWPTEQDVYNASVFHSGDYLRREWGRIFEVLEIIPNGHFYQDVVLLMKRATRLPQRGFFRRFSSVP
jgi:SAM-dependent methyltransferase